MVSPVLDQLAHERAGQIKLVKVDVDHSPQLSARFAIQAVPTLMVIVDDKIVAREAGAAPVPVLRSWLERRSPPRRRMPLRERSATMIPRSHNPMTDYGTLQISERDFWVLAF
jgi:thioredoxin-like negative regulator of GroEL